MIAYAAEIGLPASALTYSPVKGPEGNIEYLVWLKKRETVTTIKTVTTIETGDKALIESDSADRVTDRDVTRVVAEAHAALD